MNVRSGAREVDRFLFDDVGQLAIGLATGRAGGAVMAAKSTAARKARATSERTLALNRRYAVKLGWRAHRPRIAMLFGFVWSSPSEVLFAEGVAAWQRSNGIDDDGVLGPATWKRISALLGVPGRSSTNSIAAAPMPTKSPGTLIADRPGKRRFSYPFTPEDVLWTARFVIHEAGGYDNRDNQAVVQAMLNQYGFVRHTKYPTFTAFLRAYSTTLQPTLNNKAALLRALESDDFVPTGGFFPGTTLPRGQRRKHLDIQSTRWEALPGAARNLAVRALGGRMANPGIGNANEFASTLIFLTNKMRKEGERRKPTYAEWARYTENAYRHQGKRWIGEVDGIDQVKSNAFFIHEDLIGLPANSLRVEPSTS